MGAKTPTTRHVFRQRSPLALAVVFGGTGLLLLASVASSWADDPQPLYAAWVLFGLAVVWSLFVRPAVLLDGDGVTIRNVVRDIHLPWVRVTDVDFRWNLKVYAGDRAYTAWAIASQVDRPKALSVGMFGASLPGRFDKYSGASSHPTAAPKVTASMVARLIERSREEYAEAVARGALPAAPDDQVRVRWVPMVLAIVAVPAIAVVALSLA
jgi:hypothetical protein